MVTSVTLSLPEEQLLLMEKLAEMQQQLINFQISGSWLTEKEAALRFKVKECDVRTWRLEGWLRHYQVGDEIRYKSEEIDQDFEDQAKITLFTRNNKKKETGNSYLDSAQDAGNTFVRETVLQKRNTNGISAAMLKAQSRKQA